MDHSTYETYEGLWGELMFVMHDPDHLWRVNEGRADWLESLGLGATVILDLGCGNGYFDVVLARRGHQVVAVDQVQPVIDAARALVVDEPVEFSASDLRQVDFPDATFDLVTMFGVAGLMSVDDDTSIIERCSRWLRPGGHLLVDCDIDLASAETIEREHELGTIRWNWTSDSSTRTNMLDPELHRKDGSVVRLQDPIDPSRGVHEGLRRYIYPEQELSGMLRAAGFELSRVSHYTEFVFPEAEPERYMLCGRLPG